MKSLYRLCLCILATALFTACQGKSYLESQSEATSTSTLNSEEDAVYIDKGFVQITGAVKSPGVYEITGDTRLFQVIEKAGGLLADADLQRVNQAMRVSDGDNIHVMTTEEATALNTQVVEADGKLNINTADVNSLMTLPGIGESKAKMIVEYRTENGAFGKIEDIMNIPGIKEGVYNKIKDEITVL